MDELRQDLENNKRGNDNRAEKLKLKNGDNKIVILTNPVGYSTVFGIGMVYEGCEYGKYGSRKYKCYVLDLEDNQVKTADFSYTVSKKLIALADGARTAFKGFPMPYALNLKTSKAGTKEVETDILAEEDFIIPEAVSTQLDTFSPIIEVIENLKKWQIKQINENPEMQQKIDAFIAKRLQEDADRVKAKAKDKNGSVPTIQTDPDYPTDEINADDIGF